MTDQHLVSGISKPGESLHEGIYNRSLKSLVRFQSLINKETGAPQEMAGLATHLHYHEPSNYALVSFLQCGLFHELCQPGKNGKPAAPFKLND